MKARGKPFLLMLCCLLLAAALAGCQPDNNANGNTQDRAASNEEQSLDTDVFPKDKVVDVRITINPDDYQDMLDNASAEEYKAASVEYNGIKMDNVGIRTKGNLSLRSVVQMSDSDRYSFKISFDEYINQSLFGISKINLNNNYSDASYMREFLTYELAETMGLPTPKYSFVNIYVNDELKGFYLAVEQIGDAYLERNFGNAYGALYKGVMTGQGSDLTWLGDDTSLYTGLEMKSDKSNNDILLDMLDELNNGTDYEKYINVDDALGYIALNAVTGNMDSYLGSNKQNYYLYEDDGVFSILPWDYNMAFGGMGGSDVMIDEPTQGALSERPLIAKLLANDEYKAKYHAIIQQMIDGYLQDDTFQARMDELDTMISSYVKADPSAFYTFEQYESGTQSVKTFMSTMAASVSGQLDGTIAASGDGSGSGDSMGGFGGGMGGGGFGGAPGGGAPGQSAADGQAAQGDGGAALGEAQQGQGAADGQAAQGGGGAALGEAQQGQSAADGLAAQGGGGAAPGQAQQGQGAADGQAAQGDGAAAHGLAQQGQGAADGQAAQSDGGPALGQALQGQGAADGQAAQGGGGAALGQAQQGQGWPAGQYGGEPGAMGGPAMPEGGNGPGGDMAGGREFGGGVGGGFGGGMGGGFGGGDFGGAPGSTQQQGSASEAITTGVAIVVLLLAAAFITFYKRKRL
ncbi:CotH kinase family protein [Paenibacillus sp. FSL R7-0331]|uniref:CotH kinase family protein n=1 Tax=Paenibacillus sp. FSL R7-0331 TaxID=1536773 RepID=UPI0004F7DB67|nr:CotH kinase family protein [Paenibacillus sp. FSL R7-0331]AIQ52248.1 spore coat protein CotH [Paenibacillus sp. FSL R7-0331]